MLSTSSSTSNGQLFVDHFNQISKEMEKMIEENAPYTVYSTPVATIEVRNSALKVLNAMKEHFSREPTSSSVNIEGSKINDFYSYHLRPLFNIFSKCSFTIDFQEDVPPYCSLPVKSWNWYMASQSYYTSNFSVTFQDTFKDASFLKA